MWRDSFHKLIRRRAWLAVALPVWVGVSFITAQVVVIGVLRLLQTAGVRVDALNDNVFAALMAAIVYGLTLALVVGVPWLVRRSVTTRQQLGLTRPMQWLDIVLAPAGFVVYFLLSALLLLVATQLLPFIDANQVQDTGFSQLTQRYEFLLAFMTLVILAPVAEELLFRGYLLGKLTQHAPVWLAIGVTSLLFALIHGAWNVGIDVFALSIVLCLLRVWTGSLWPSILLHMLKNGVAFYLLFVNSLLG